jgi:hypothetical protein
LHFGCSGQINGGGIKPNVHRFHRARGVGRQERSGERDHYSSQATHHGQRKTPARSITI